MAAERRLPKRVTLRRKKTRIAPTGAVRVSDDGNSRAQLVGTTGGDDIPLLGEEPRRLVDSARRLVCATRKAMHLSE